MKAVVYHEYGPPDVLQVRDMEKPTPANNEVLIRVRATPVSYGDLMARKFGQLSSAEFNMPGLFWLLARLDFGLKKPRKHILGSEFAGVVEAVGQNVQQFKQGDAVFGYRGQNFGAYAEYLCMLEDGLLALKPDTMTFEEATAVPYGALTALNLLRKADIQSGERVLIIGASGSIGSAAVQLAKHHFGARVTGVCSTPRVGMVQALGADRVIDYTKENFAQSDETYDLIFDVLGKGSFTDCRDLLAENGRYLYVSFKMKQLWQMLKTKITGNKKIICALSLEKPEDLVFIKTLIEGGKIKSVIDRCYPLEQIVEAHHYAKNGGKKGNVIITLNH